MTSIFGGFVIFSYLGYMAGQLQVDVKDVAADGELVNHFTTSWLFYRCKLDESICHIMGVC